MTRLLNWTVSVFADNDSNDVGAWQKQIDARYVLEIEPTTSLVSLYDGGKLVQRFVWDGIIEIQSLHGKEFPPLMWRVISKSGIYLIPSGGRYAEHFEKDLIRQLPDYRLQMAVKVPPPFGYKSATSLWRAADPYPKMSLEERDNLDDLLF